MFFRTWKLLVTTFQIWDRSNSSRMSAAMTYYTMLSLAPLLMIAIAIAGYVFDDTLIESEIIENVSAFTSPEIASTVAGLIKNATRPTSGLVASSISLLVLFYGASGVFTQLFDTFNEIWQVPLDSRSGIRFNIRKRLIGVLMVLVAGILLAGTLGLSTAIAYLNGLVADTYPQLTTWLNLADKGLSFILMPFVLSLIFWFFPAKKIHWTDVMPAAGLTAAMLAASRYATNLYLQFSSTSEVYGAAGSLVVLLIWVYITGLVVFFGASFSCAWAETFGSHSDLGCPEDELDALERQQDQGLSAIPDCQSVPQTPCPPAPPSNQDAPPTFSLPLLITEKNSAAKNSKTPSADLPPLVLRRR